MNEIYRRSFRPETLEVRAEGAQSLAQPCRSTLQLRSATSTERISNSLHLVPCSHHCRAWAKSRQVEELQHAMHQLPIGRAFVDLREELAGLWPSFA